MICTRSLIPFIVPDLTFSEITFLNTRRGNLQDLDKPAEMNQKRKKHKIADTEAEMSRYFASTGCRNLRGTTASDERLGSLDNSDPPKRCHKQRVTEMSTYPDQSSLPPVDLPETPFLGFGSVGGSLVSPVRRNDSPILAHRRLEPTRHDKSSICSASYFSWSETRSPSHHSTRPRDDECLPPIPPTRARNVEKSYRNVNAGELTISGVALAHDESTGETRLFPKHINNDGSGKDDVKTPFCEISNNVQKSNLSQPLRTTSSKQQESYGSGPKSIGNIDVHQKSPQIDLVNGTEGHETHKKPLPPKTNDPSPKTPEDLVNATLKLLLEKYGPSITVTPTAVAAVADGKPNPSDTVSSKEHQRGSDCPVPAKAGGGEAVEYRSDRTQVQESFSSPRALSQRTDHTETELSGKSSPRDRPSNEVTKVPLGTQKGSSDSQIQQTPMSNLQPFLLQSTDARSAWTGYDAIYEQQQATSERPQFNANYDKLQDNPGLNMDVMDYPVVFSGYDMKHMYEPSFDVLRYDHVNSKSESRDLYDTQYEAQPFQEFQGGANRGRIRGRQLGEWPHYGRSMEAPDERIFECGDEYLPDEEPACQEYNSEQADFVPSMDTFENVPPAIQSIVNNPGHGGCSPFQRRMQRDQPSQTWYSRPCTQGSSRGSVPQKCLAPSDRIDDTTLPGFWKPHRLY